MLPAATLPAARYYVAPARRRRAGGRALAGPRGGKKPARDAAAGLDEGLAMPAIWKDAARDPLGPPRPGGGVVGCGAPPRAAAPGPARGGGPPGGAGGSA